VCLALPSPRDQLGCCRSSIWAHCCHPVMTGAGIDVTWRVCHSSILNTSLQLLHKLQQSCRDGCCCIACSSKRWLG